MKRGVISAMVFILVVSIVGDGALADTQTRQFKVCVPDYSVGVMPFFIAKQNGYFASEQMNVEVIAGRGNLCTMGLIAGSFQFTYSPSTFDAIVAGDIKGKTIYVAEKFLLHRFIVSPQIKRFEDLKGKKIAISAFGTLTDLLTREILLDHGLKPMQDVLLLQTGGVPVRLAALLSGNVQGTLLASQQALAAIHDGYNNLEYTPPPYVSHPLIVKNEMLGNEKPVVRSFVRAFYKGHLFFGQKPEETLNIIQKVLRIDDRKTARETYEDELRRYNPGGGFDGKSMRKVIERVRETRKMDRRVETSDVFDLSLAAEVQAELKKAGWKP
ncbi:MAG TPA: ABC transporter substrate-binding protein [Candidatus Binatia bacterium]|jgi:ABC-type nitrate/sulfonate/bicarbonate transport system substrate-binding protein